ncbi:MAG: TVP38/TMEM64 family protein, partial [Deltaproteobacteria bacterium]|nr:TVP38/TMEM64 family protein [Deltaproteobacteria bacterium]
MEETLQQPTKKTSKAVLKAIIFAAFIIGAIFFIRFTPVKNYLTAEALSRFLETAGLWAPVVYMMIYTVGVCLFLPGTLLTGLG